MKNLSAVVYTPSVCCIFQLVNKDTHTQHTLPHVTHTNIHSTHTFTLTQTHADTVRYTEKAKENTKTANEKVKMTVRSLVQCLNNKNKINLNHRRFIHFSR
jgi:type IV secretory pathway TrbF-like protein